MSNCSLDLDHTRPDDSVAQLVALMSGVVLGGVVEVVGSNLARGKIFKASIGSVDSLCYPGIQFRLPCTPFQDNFSWVPNCSLGPPGWETKVSSKKVWFGLCEIAWFLWQPIANLRRGVCLQNYSYLSCYFIFASQGY